MCGVWFGGHGVGTFMIGCRRARAMPPPFQLPSLYSSSQRERGSPSGLTLDLRQSQDKDGLPEGGELQWLSSFLPWWKA